MYMYIFTLILCVQIHERYRNLFLKGIHTLYTNCILQDFAKTCTMKKKIKAIILNQNRNKERATSA